MKTWYSLRNAHGVGELAIYDEIGAYGITAARFRDDLTALGGINALNVRINSPGGDVFDGLAMYHLLKTHPATVTVTVDGIAASIASVIAMAGAPIEMSESAFMMIHDPTGAVVGTSKELRELADALDKVKQSLVNTYRHKSGLTEARIGELMSSETWLTAAEAVELGLADRVSAPVKMAASLNLSRFRNPPQALQSHQALRASEVYARRRPA